MRRAAVLALALCACADEPGRFHPDTVLALGKSRGDATGTAHSGSWSVRMTAVDCTCDEIVDPTTELPTDFCFDPTVLGMVGFELTEADGSLRVLATLPDDLGASSQIAALVLELFDPFDQLGRIDDDGTIAVGAVKSSSSPIGGARLILRTDGTITDYEEPIAGSVAELDAELFLFIRVDLADSVTTCGAQYDLTATMPQQGPWPVD